MPLPIIFVNGFRHVGYYGFDYCCCRCYFSDFTMFCKISLYFGSKFSLRTSGCKVLLVAAATVTTVTAVTTVEQGFSIIFYPVPFCNMTNNRR